LCGATVLHPKPERLSKGFILENIQELSSNFLLYLLKEKGSRGLSMEEFFKLTGYRPNTQKVVKYAHKVGNRFYLGERSDLNAPHSQSFSPAQLERLMDSLGRGFHPVADLDVDRELIREAVQRGYIHRLGGDVLISDRFLKELVERLRGLGNGFSIREAKTELGLSRRLLVALLEHLDGLGYTVRRGDRRFWRRL
jgi:selenocysteine-specific elongation factor